VIRFHFERLIDVLECIGELFLLVEVLGAQAQIIGLLRLQFDRLIEVGQLLFRVLFAERRGSA